MQQPERYDVLTRRLHHATASLRSSGTWLDALGLAGRLRGFSFKNTLMVLDQWQERLAKDSTIPEPSLLATRLEWSRLGWPVRDGQRGYTIFAPGGAMVVCDAAQLVDSVQKPGRPHPTLPAGRAPAGLGAELTHLIAGEDYQVIVAPGVGGQVDRAARTVLVPPDANPAEQVAGLATGFADLWLHTTIQQAENPRLADAEARAAAGMLMAATGMSLDQHVCGPVDLWAGRETDRHDTILKVGETARIAALSILIRLDVPRIGDGTVQVIEPRIQPAPVFGQQVSQSALSGMAVGA